MLTNRQAKFEKASLAWQLWNFYEKQLICVWLCTQPSKTNRTYIHSIPVNNNTLRLPFKMEENRSVHNPTDDPSEKLKRRVFSSTTRQLLGSSLAWIGFALFGWYFPRSLVDRETSILSLQPPYQTTAGGDVIVDFELNQPLVDPPTVDSEYCSLVSSCLGVSKENERVLYNPIHESHPISFETNRIINRFFSVYEKDFLLRSSSIFFPLIVMMLHAWYSETPADSTASTVHKQYRVATVVSAFSAAMGLSEGSTVLIKLWVQRRRPNFYALCGFDSTTKMCTASIKHVREVWTWVWLHNVGWNSTIFVYWFIHNSFFFLRSMRCALFVCKTTGQLFVSFGAFESGVLWHDVFGMVSTRHNGKFESFEQF